MFFSILWNSFSPAVRNISFCFGMYAFHSKFYAVLHQIDLKNLHACNKNTQFYFIQYLLNNKQIKQSLLRYVCCFLWYTNKLFFYHTLKIAINRNMFTGNSGRLSD